MRRLRQLSIFILSLFASGLLVVSAANAAPAYKEGHQFEKGITNPQDRNMFLWSEDADRYSHQFSPGNTSLEMDGIGRFYEDTYVTSAYSNINKWCDEGSSGNITDCVAPSGGTDESYYNEPGKRKSSVTAFDPMAGFHTTMTSQAYTDGVNGLLSSPMSILQVAWLMTEPAVSMGVANAMKISNGFLHSRYLADQSFLKRADATPETRQIILESYNNCIARHMQGIGEDYKDTGNPPKSWVEAQSLCLGGARIETTGGIKPFKTVDHDSTYKMVDNPSHSKRMEKFALSGTTASTDKDSLLLTELLFSQETGFEHEFEWLGRKTSPSSSSANDSALKAMAASWRMIFGDIKFSIKPGFSPGVKEFEIQKIAAQVQPGSGSGLGTSLRRGGGEWYYRNLVKELYKDINDLMFNMCKYANGEVPLGDNPSHYANPYLWVAATHTAFFWNNDKFLFGDGGVLKNAHPDRLAMRGFWLQPHIGDLLFYMFAREEGAKSNGQFNCARLDMDNASSEGHLSNIMNSISSSTNTDVGLRAIVRKRIRNYWYLAKKIGMGQLLMTLKRAEEILQGLSIGAYDTVVKRYGLGMIYQAAGTKDIYDSYEKNLQELRFYLEGMYQRRANGIGSSSVFARDMQKEDSAPSRMDQSSD
ncbi:hypothetical protein OAO01_08175 [Oligoflexia bacterium]|nr:hypothetical protein [Oligoflexia bacterium]